MSLEGDIWAKKLLGPKETQIWLHGLNSLLIFASQSKNGVYMMFTFAQIPTVFDICSKSLRLLSLDFRSLDFEVWFEIKNKLTLIDYLGFLKRGGWVYLLPCDFITLGFDTKESSNEFLCCSHRFSHGFMILLTDMSTLWKLPSQAEVLIHPLYLGLPVRNLISFYR